MQALNSVGIDFQTVAAQLEDEGIDGFSKSYNALVADIEDKSARFRKST